jgi:MFS-type transporter involved in bile tolerance (Atg22 family)
VSFILSAIGVLLLLICLVGIVLGIYMASDERNREGGFLFALCWVSGAGGAAGVAMRDGVTFLVGLFCFLVAGAVFLMFGDVQTGSARRQREKPRGPAPEGPAPEGSEKTTRENRSGHRQRRAAS